MTPPVTNPNSLRRLNRFEILLKVFGEDRLEAIAKEWMTTYNGEHSLGTPQSTDDFLTFAEERSNPHVSS